MVFSEVLEDVAGRLPGCLGLVVMGMDGIPIDRLTLDNDFNFEMLATECTTILKNSRQASEEVGGGPLLEVIVMTESLVVLAQAITEDYVLLGAVRSGSPYGRARFLLQQASMKLEKEFV